MSTPGHPTSLIRPRAAELMLGRKLHDSLPRYIGNNNNFLDNATKKRILEIKRKAKHTDGITEIPPHQIGSRVAIRSRLIPIGRSSEQ